MMQPAVGDEEHAAARDLAVDDAAHVDTCLAYEIAAELDHDLCERQLAAGACGNFGEARLDDREVEPALAGKIRNAEAAAKIQHTHGRRRVLREAQREIEGGVLRVADRTGVEVLRAGENVEALEAERELTHAGEQGRCGFDIDAELPRAAAHAHPGTLELEVGIDAQR